MKRIIMTVANVVAFAAITHAVEPLSFGVKVGAGANIMRNVLERIGSPTSKFETTPFNMGFNAHLYGEYAFHDMVGGGLKAGYAGGSLTGVRPKNAKNDDNTVKVNQHSVDIAPYVAIYPLGREDKEEIGIMFVNLGGKVTLPLSTKMSGKSGGKELSEAQSKFGDKEVKGFGMGAFLAVGYEFSFGLTVEGGASYMFTDTFTEEYYKANKDKSCNVFNGGLALGYNFATLME